MSKEVKKVCVLGAYDFDSEWVDQSMFIQFLGKQGLTYMEHIGEELLVSTQPIEPEVVTAFVKGTDTAKDILEGANWNITQYDPIRGLIIQGAYDLVRGLQLVDEDDLSLEDLKANYLD